MNAPTESRDARIDALRGFALLGILLVNIQSFVWGGTNPAGYLLDDATSLDRALFFLTVAFVNVKFMPLFAMLFGVGFSLLLAKLITRTSAPETVYRRRLAFLFSFGILHGVFLYYGDITHMYAIAGYVLLHYADRDLMALRRSVLLWWLAAFVIAALLIGYAANHVPGPAEVAAELRDNFVVLTREGYVGQLGTRLALFFDIAIANVVGLPLTIALMLTGMLAQRSGWLSDRRAPAWRHATVLGIAVGLPAALLYGAMQTIEADTYGLGAYSVIAGLPGLVSITLSFAYAALFITRAPAALVQWLAPAGRMPLTNYLLQSIAMGALLSGWGLALGAWLSYTQTALLALAIFVIQVLASHLWLRHWRQGPLEAVWRSWTYYRMPPVAAPDVRTAV